MAADKTPKADRLREQREARFNAEQVRQKAEEQRTRQAAIIAVKTRSKEQQVEDRAAIAAMASKLGRKFR